MRVIEVDAGPVLPLLNTALSGFAMWVNVSKRDVPEEIHVMPKTQMVGLKFVYENEYKAFVRKATPNVTMYCFNELNTVAGFDIPVRNFQGELRNLMAWLKEEQHNVNMATVRNNYRLIAAILHVKANELFIPPQ